VGVDRQHQVLAVAEQIERGMRLAFCTRNAEAAQLDLARIATEIRDELASGTAHGGRGICQLLGTRRPALRRAHAELQVVRNALGDVPLVGFFAGGEIARHHLLRLHRGIDGVLLHQAELVGGAVSTARSCLPAASLGNLFESGWTIKILIGDMNGERPGRSDSMPERSKQVTHETTTR